MTLQSCRRPVHFFIISIMARYVRTGRNLRLTVCHSAFGTNAQPASSDAEGLGFGNQFSGHRRYPLMPFLHPWAFFPVQAYFCILSPDLASFGVFRLLLRSKVHLIWSMIDSFSSLLLLSPAFGTIISLLFIWG